MLQQGMVHALREIHRLIKSTGYLVDIHPTQEKTQFEVHEKNGKVTLSVQVPGQTFTDIRHAEDAIDRVKREGFYSLEKAIEFEIRIYASSIKEMCDYLVKESAYDETPPHELAALQQEELVKKVERSLHDAGRGSQMACVYPARISRLKPLRKT